jgi:hypothetical protein
MAARLNEYGKYYHVELVWRGRMYRVQIFFPKLNKPQRVDIQTQASKIYPGCRIISYLETDKIEDVPAFLAFESYSYGS